MMGDRPQSSPGKGVAASPDGRGRSGGVWKQIVALFRRVWFRFSFSEVLSLGNESIGYVCQKLMDDLAAYGLDRKNILRLSLSLEEMLLRWQDGCGADAETVQIYLKGGMKLGRPYVLLTYEGPRQPPVGQDDGEFDMVKNLGLSFSFDYQRGVNRLCLQLERKSLTLVGKVVLAVGLALGIGAGISVGCPGWIPSAMKWAIEPTLLLYMNILTVVAVPIVFIGLLHGIYALGEFEGFMKLGWRFVGGLLVTSAVLAVAMLPVCYYANSFVLPPMHGTGHGVGDMDLMRFLREMVPDGFVGSVASNRVFPVVLLVLVGGIVLFNVNIPRTKVAPLLEGLNKIVVYVSNVLLVLLPYYLFFMVLKMVFAANARHMLAGCRIMVFVVAFMAGLMMLEWLWAAIRLRVNPCVLLRKIFPGAVVALISGSGLVAYPVNLETGQRDMGIDDHFVKFGHTVCLSVFKPGTMVLFILCAFLMYPLFGMQISLHGALVCIALSAMLAMANSPIGSSNLISFGILFPQLGFPPEALSLVFLMNVILEQMDNAMNNWFAQLQVAVFASRNHLLDRNVLTTSR